MPHFLPAAPDQHEKSLIARGSGEVIGLSPWM
jgi:hypothetical protein